MVRGVPCTTASLSIFGCLILIPICPVCSFVSAAGGTQHLNVSLFSWTPIYLGDITVAFRERTLDLSDAFSSKSFCCESLMCACSDKSSTWLRTRTCPRHLVPDTVRCMGWQPHSHLTWNRSSCLSNRMERSMGGGGANFSIWSVKLREQSKQQWSINWTISQNHV